MKNMRGLNVREGLPFSKKWRYEFTVRGSRWFPADMLRYDECFPKQEGEARRISYRDHEYDDAPYEVTLVHFDSSADWKPTFARWKSFGWEVL